MWTLRFYNRKDDELQHEIALPDMREPVALLGYAPTKVGSTPLRDHEALKVAEAFNLAIPEGLDAFLDFDQEPQPAPPERVPDAPSMALATQGQSE